MSLRESLPTSGADVSFTDLFTRALLGFPCAVVGLAAEPEVLPVHSWSREADPADLALLDHCVGSTVDLGCGPGRLAEALAGRGHAVLGVDVVEEAVGQTRDRGVTAVCQDVFTQIPAEGRWRTALLADGNVGIGGDPVALLARVRRLLQPDGQVVVEVAPPGVPMLVEWAVLECDGARSRPFRWALIGADDIGWVGHEAGFDLTHSGGFGDGRWCAVLRKRREVSPDAG